jgi:lipoate-protein ligase A
MKVLDLTLPTPPENLACDEALLDAAEAGQSGEVLRFWESPEHFVVVGYANKVATEVNTAACEACGIPILRRCSGGGTVVQGPGCLNYALILRIAVGGPTRNISCANQYIMQRNRKAIDSAFQVRGHTDLAHGELKFSGNAQRRRKHFLLFHGTFLLEFDLGLVSKLLQMPSQQPDYRDGRGHEAFITNLDVTPNAIKAAMEVIWNANESAASPSQSAIQKLVDEKYSRSEWNSKF